MARGLQESQQNPEITVNELIMGYVELDVAGGDDYVISDDEFNHALFDLTGAVTENIDIVVPDDPKIYYFMNNTTGGFTITVTTVAGSGEAVTAGTPAILASNGTDVIAFVS